MRTFKEITDKTILDDVVDMMKVNRYVAWSDNPEAAAQEFQDMIDYVEGKRKEIK
jgi:hypothetical protein